MADGKHSDRSIDRDTARLFQIEGAAEPGVKSITRLRNLSSHWKDAVISIAQQEIEGYLVEVGGAKGISVADLLEPQQISTDLYIGATSPLASTEMPHWHPKQTEAYLIVHGTAQILAKYRADRQWTTTRLRDGDLLIVQSEICHWFRWVSRQGLAYVFKAPQVPGVGRAPNGKTTCDSCAHSDCCQRPEGYIRQG